MLCIKDYKIAFDRLRALYEEEVRNRIVREADTSPEQNDSKETSHDVCAAREPPHTGNMCPTGQVSSSSDNSKQVNVCVNCKLLEEELSRMRVELEEASERLWSNREESLSDILKLKHSLHVSELERTRLQGLADHMDSKRRSRASTPQLPHEEFLVIRNELENSRVTIAELQGYIATLETSQNLMKEKYMRLKSKYRTITDKLKSGLIDQLTQAKSHPPTRSVSLMQLYPCSGSVISLLYST